MPAVTGQLCERLILNQPYHKIGHQGFLVLHSMLKRLFHEIRPSLVPQYNYTIIIIFRVLIFMCNLPKLLGVSHLQARTHLHQWLVCLSPALAPRLRNQHLCPRRVVCWLSTRLPVRALPKPQHLVSPLSIRLQRVSISTRLNHLLPLSRLFLLR
jgi:hypothetical protein